MLCKLVSLIRVETESFMNMGMNANIIIGILAQSTEKHLLSSD